MALETQYRQVQSRKRRLLLAGVLVAAGCLCIWALARWRVMLGPGGKRVAISNPLIKCKALYLGGDNATIPVRTDLRGDAVVFTIRIPTKDSRRRITIVPECDMAVT